MNIEFRKSSTLVLIVFIIILFNFTVFFFTTQNIVSSSKIEKNIKHSEILNIELDDSGSYLNYYLRNKQGDIISKPGIESFTVDDEGKIYLSNYSTEHIYIYHNNKKEGQIYISDYSQPRDIKLVNGILYILEDSGKLSEINLDSSENKEYDIPTIYNKESDVINVGRSNDFSDNSAIMPVRLVSDYQSNTVNTLYDNNLLFLHNKDKNIKFPVDQFPLEGLEGQVYKQFLGIDEEENIYIKGTEVISKDDLVEIEEWVYKFNQSGELLAVAETVNDRNFITPFKYLDVNSSGEVFQLLVQEDRVKVFKLAFNNDMPVIDINDKADKIQKTDNDLISSSLEPSAREKLYNKAVQLIDYKWTYEPEYNYIEKNEIVIPYYLQDIKEKTELVGIPYCWGGYDSITTGSLHQDWDNFADAIKKGAAAGNIGTISNYIPGTSGLDCSGFISAVLEMDFKKPSWYFLYENELVKKISYDELELMDILVKKGHIFFFVDRTDYGIVSMETNTLGSEWKVKYFIWSWRSLRDMGYSSRGLEL
ncbi:MAG: hypothetical protein ACOCRL_01400 [Bacillota bacterium]